MMFGHHAQDGHPESLPYRDWARCTEEQRSERASASRPESTGGHRSSAFTALYDVLLQPLPDHLYECASLYGRHWVAERLLGKPEAIASISSWLEGQYPGGSVPAIAQFEAGGESLVLALGGDRVLVLGNARDTIESNHLLQPIAAIHTDGFYAAIFQRIETEQVTPGDVLRMHELLAGEGREFTDPHPRNLGITADGRLVVLDRNAIDYKRCGGATIDPEVLAEIRLHWGRPTSETVSALAACFDDLFARIGGEYRLAITPAETLVFRGPPAEVSDSTLRILIGSFASERFCLRYRGRGADGFEIAIEPR